MSQLSKLVKNSDRIAPNYYPEFIIEPKHKYRSVKFIVKKQNTLVETADELIEAAQKAYNDYNSDRSSSPSSSQRQQGSKQRDNKKIKADPIWSFALPLPNELTESQNHQWETSKGAVGSIVGGLENVEVGIRSIKVSASKALGEISKSAGFRKPLINPGYFQNYNGTEPRTFTFSWDLIPNNVNEANNIVEMIYNIKKFTLPESSIDGLLWTSPYIFEVEIGNPKIDQMMRLANFVCTSVEVQYSAEGALQFLPDGTPKYTRLSMSFAEALVQTADQW